MQRSRKSSTESSREEESELCPVGACFVLRLKQERFFFPKFRYLSNFICTLKSNLFVHTIGPKYARCHKQLTVSFYPSGALNYCFATVCNYWERGRLEHRLYLDLDIIKLCSCSKSIPNLFKINWQTLSKHMKRHTSFQQAYGTNCI